MKRLAAVVCSAVVLAAVAACGPFGDGGPLRHEVLLPEPAPPSAQWIVDTVNGMGEPPKGCPRPTLATLAVLDDDGHSRAMAFWLVDDVDVCFATIGDPGIGVGFGPIEGLFHDHPEPVTRLPDVEMYVFTALPSRTDHVRLTGATEHVPHPAHSRTVDLGGGRFVTFVEYGVVVPPHDEGVPLALCPDTGQCRDVTIPRLTFASPALTPCEACGVWVPGGVTVVNGKKAQAWTAGHRPQDAEQCPASPKPQPHPHPHPHPPAHGQNGGAT